MTNTDPPLPAAQPTWRSLLVSGRSLRYAAGVLLVAAGYYAAVQGGLTLLLTGPAGAFWPATGVGIAVLYLGGWRWWPGVLVGDLLTREFTLPLWAVLAETAGNLARALLAVVILRRLVGRRAAMDRLEQVGAVFVAVAVGEAVSATVAMLARQAGGLIDVSEMGVFWRSWWLGGLAGGLVVVPLALAWAHPRASVWRGRRAAEAALTLAAVIGLSVIAFSADQPFTYIVFPAFIWAALELAESQRREGERAALERQRIARDLHDSVSQSLFSTTLHVRTAQRALELEQLDGTGPVGEELGEIGQLTRGALAEMRALILELRPGALAEEGLVAALAKQAAAQSAREGLVIEVDGPDADLPLGPEVEERLYRLGQEALANVVKHARASSATVRIAANDDVVTIEVSDDGRGFDPAAVGPEHFGLRSMRGRAADLGGRLELTSAPGGGTVLRVQVPARR